MIPTIQTEIELLQNTKDELRTAIMEKGVSVSSNDLFSTYPTRISQISMTPGDKDDLFKSLIDRSITSLVVPDGTEILRPHVFSGCGSITSLTLPNSLKIIYNGALTGLHGVTTLVIPDSVKRIESSSSYPNTTTSLTSLTLGSGLEYIGNTTFYNRTNLTSITCLAATPPTLNTNTNAFDNTNNCPIYVPEDSVDAYKAAWTKYADRIQAMASTRKGRVHYQDGTTSDIPLNGIRTLYANELESLIVDGNPIVGLEVSNQCTKIAKSSDSGGGSNYGFWLYAPELSWVRASSTVTALGNNVFESCEHITSLDDIQLPGVTTYPSYAFQSCLGLTDVNIPEGIETVSSSCFYHCQNISSLHIPSTLTGFNDYIQKDYSTTYTPLTSITVDPNNTTYTSVGNCLIRLYNGVYRLVLGCSTSVIPDNLTDLYISTNAFLNNIQGNSRDYTVPANVATIGNNAFGNANSVTMLSSTPCALLGSAFGYTFPIYVPSGSLETYLADSSWAVYKDRLFEIGVAKWTEQSYQCEVDETNTKTGMVTVVEKDTNPTSGTYNQTRQRTYEDLKRCNPVTGFTKITSLDEATSGKYLIVDTANNIALNASLIASTTSTANGINAFGNHISVGITDDTIEATDTTLNAAVDYDGENKTLSWTDENTRIYYLWPANTGANFNTSTSNPQNSVTPYLNTTNGGITFKASNSSTRAIALFTNTSNNSKFRWQPTNTDSNFDNIALFKLN